MRALIDTCIMIDALQSREPFFKEALNRLPNKVVFSLYGLE